jgi:hypothetical protein
MRGVVLSTLTESQTRQDLEGTFLPCPLARRPAHSLSAVAADLVSLRWFFGGLHWELRWGLGSPPDLRTSIIDIESPPNS